MEPVCGKRTWGRGVSFNQGHAGLGYGPDENSKEDGGWGKSWQLGYWTPALSQLHDNYLSVPLLLTG